MYEDYLKTAVEVSLRAGKIIKDNFSLNIEIETKADNTPVTKVDKKVNRLVIDTIKNKYPEHCVLGEEESTKISGDLVWVCDPLDGTIPYVHGMQTSCFSLALCDKGVPIVGVVYDPYQDLLNTAVKGGGSYLNNEKIRVSDKARLESEVITASLSKGWGGLFKAFIDDGVRVLNSGSYIYGAKYVASGHILGAMISFGSPWDGAAIKVIVEEAGGKVTDMFGQDRDYTKFGYGQVVSNGVVHDKLLEYIRMNISDEKIKKRLSDAMIH